MANNSAKKRLWGWFFFDWASQPYNTLLLTFIFGPYVKEVLGDGTSAQAAWGFGIGAAGVVIAILAPILGAIAETSGNRLRWIWMFSAMYVVGALGLWTAAPDNFNLFLTLILFAIGLIGMEFATIFTNSMLPDLGTRKEIGKISGNGFAMGYVGGLLSLVVMLLFFAESATTGKTFIGLDPLFGLDASQREGTRFVGPLSAIWYIVFMIPFFLYVRDPKTAKPEAGAVKEALVNLLQTIKNLPKTPSLFAYLGSSMFYRDGLTGMFVFGGIYATQALNWSVVDTGVFGILTILSAALFSYLGGRFDSAYGPKPVIVCGVTMLLLVSILVLFVSRASVFGIPVEETSKLPDITFYILGVLIGGSGGTLQAASRTMMVRQANPDRMIEGFGLYALAGKSTSFIAPLSIGFATYATGSAQLGVSPLIGLFLIGLILLVWVKPDGE